ncbi:hypothetical protein H4R33_002984 [Dimargaris cristalligena]|nr:hypothetical protein H4R33_002984 [Dimargaris cristalligena]
MTKHAPSMNYIILSVGLMATACQMVLGMYGGGGDFVRPLRMVNYQDVKSPSKVAPELNNERKHHADVQGPFNCQKLQGMAAVFKQVIQDGTENNSKTADPELVDDYLGWIRKDLESHLTLSASRGTITPAGTPTPYKEVDWTSVSDNQKAMLFPLLRCAAQYPAEVLQYVSNVQELLHTYGDELMTRWINLTVGRSPAGDSDRIAFITYMQTILVEKILWAIAAESATGEGWVRVLNYCATKTCSLPMIVAGLNDPSVTEKTVALTTLTAKNLPPISSIMFKIVAD